MQDSLFSEDFNDALRDAIRALGGPKEVGTRLRPEMAADAAGGWLKDCLNPTRRERLNPEQVLWILRESRKAGCHSAMNYLCDEAGYVRPSPLEPQDEAAQLMRQYIDAVAMLKKLTDKGERIGLRVA
jgi:hypothetical protein